MQHHIYRRFIEKRTLFAFLSLAVVLFAGWGATQLKLKTHYSVFFDKADPQRVAHESLESDFTPADNIYFVIKPRNGTVFTASTLKAISTLTEKAWQLPYSVRVDSIANYLLVEASNEQISSSPAITSSFSYSDDAINALRHKLKQHTELNHVLLAEDDSMTGVNIAFAIPYADEKAPREATLAARQLRDEILKNTPDLDIDIVGQVAFNWDFTELAEIDGRTLFPVMFAVIFLIMGYFYRSVAAVISTMTLIVMSSVFAMGVAGWLGYALNPINLVAATIIMTVAVADCVHILNEFYTQRRAGNSAHQALVDSYAINNWPVAITSLTTAIGFLGLNFSASPPFRELGNMTALGVVAAWILIYTLFPALLLKLHGASDIAETRKPHAIQDRTSHFFAGLIGWIKSLKDRTVIVMLAFFILLSLGAMLNRLDERVLLYFDESIPFRKAVESMQDKLLGFDRIAYRLSSSEKNGIHAPEFLLPTDAFVTWLRSQPEVTQVTSYTDVIKTLHQTLNHDNPDFHILPADRASLSQLALAYEMSLPFGADINNLVDSSRSSVRISVGLRAQSAGELLAFDERAQHWFRQHMPPHVTTSNGASVSMMFADIGKRNIYSMVQGSVIITLIITLCLMVAIRSFKYGLLMLVPNVVPAMVTFGLWGIFTGEINMAVAVVFCISLGIVVDDTIHFTSKFLYARRQLCLMPSAAIDYAYEKVGTAMSITSATLVCGFLVLALSPLMVNAYMGILVALTLFIACVFDLVIFPRILLWAESASADSSVRAPAQ